MRERKSPQRDSGSGEHPRRLSRTSQLKVTISITALSALVGSLVLGQNQECYGACFSPSESLSGDLAALRIWGRAKSKVRSCPYDSPLGMLSKQNKFAVNVFHPILKYDTPAEGVDVDILNGFLAS